MCIRDSLSVRPKGIEGCPDETHLWSDPAKSVDKTTSAVEAKLVKALADGDRFRQHFDADVQFYSVASNIIGISLTKMATGNQCSIVP